MTSTEARTTTADYARVLFNGEQAQDTTTPVEQPTPQQGNTDTKTKKTKTKAANKPQPQESEGHTGHALRAASWTPADFASVAPSSLADSVAGHRDRYQAIGNPAGKVLYGLYALAAVPTSIVLNLISLATAHASVAINEPSRIRHALLGVLFLGIVIGGVVWAGA